jgi:hypothetical protein
LVRVTNSIPSVFAVVGEEGAGPNTIHPPQKRVHNIGGEYMEEDFENDELAAAFAVKSDQLEVEFGPEGADALFGPEGADALRHEKP